MSEANHEQPIIADIGDFVGTLGVAINLFVPGGAALARLAALGAALIARGVAGNEQLRELGAEVQAMVDAGVNPRSDQWDALAARHEAAHARIQASRPSSED